ncbi:hypothetical protein DWB84_18475 [Saccharophagus sp. K07]|jgi:hypothetical protein|uniref:hypothetical protein n=1 Tax=Saccharophagus sp. K07 TaxID=2283636 RepID=UPI0016526205|nr:hypothetical protein [Saccharophagus sp. K07]MBC6907425.1 hypothetical protein [Saccharophagus sp. K07]
MGTVQRPNRLFLLVIFYLSAALAACSSGGGSSSHSNRDITPDSFTLTAPNGVDPTKVDFGDEIVSAPVTITGIDGPAPVSITGGEFKIDNGAFTSTPTTIRNGQSIQVKVQSPIKAEQTATAILTIGGIEASFTVTTGPDTTPPEVSILFPPLASMTEGQTLFVRGTVKDVHGKLEDGAVTVNGVEAELELNEAKDEGTWSVTVDLQPGENVVEVTAIDVAKNAIEEDKPSVRSRRVESIVGESFPDDVVPFSEPISIGLHTVGGKTSALVTDPSEQAVIAVDLLTGERTSFSDNDKQVDNPLEYPWSIHVAGGDQIYVFDWDFQNPRIYTLDGAGKREIFLRKNDPENSIVQPFGLYLRASSNGASLYLADRSKIIRYDVKTKDREIISDSVNGVPDLNNPIKDAVDMTFSESKGQFIVIDALGDNSIYYVNPQTGSRNKIEINETLAITGGSVLAGKFFVAVETTQKRISIIDLDSGSVTPVATSEMDSVNLLREPRGVVVSPNGGYLLVVDRSLRAIVAIDLDHHHQVVLSKFE